VSLLCDAVALESEVYVNHLKEEEGKMRHCSVEKRLQSLSYLIMTVINEAKCKPSTRMET
jgi:hypothetical protein